MEINYELKASVLVNQATGQTTVTVPPITMLMQFDLNLFLETTAFLLAHNQKHNGQNTEQLLAYAHNYINHQFNHYKNNINK